MNLSTKQKQNHGYREQTGAGQRGGVGGGRERKFRVNRYKFLYIERMNKKDPDV